MWCNQKSKSNICHTLCCNKETISKSSICRNEETIIMASDGKGTQCEECHSNIRTYLIMYVSGYTWSCLYQDIPDVCIRMVTFWYFTFHFSLFTDHVCIRMVTFWLNGEETSSETESALEQGFPSSNTYSGFCQIKKRTGNTIRTWTRSEGKTLFRKCHQISC